MSTLFFRKVLLRRDCLTSIALITKLPLDSCRSYSQPTILLNMKEAILTHHKEKDEFDISFHYTDENPKMDRTFRFSRQVSDTVDTFLYKINAKISKHRMKKIKNLMKKGKILEMPMEEDSVQSGKIKVLKNDLKVDGDLPCKFMFDDISDIKLIIFNRVYTLKAAAPTICKMGLPRCILVDFPVYPLKYKCTNIDMSQTIFRWYKTYARQPTCSKWVEVGQDFFYIPKPSDVGCTLKVTCEPKIGEEVGPAIEVVAKTRVNAGIGPCPTDMRHAFTRTKLSGESFRVVSYNLLASIYARSNYSKQVLFPYCAEYALNINYRKQLILKELMGFNADIMCLQEVDNFVYEHDLFQCLSRLNYGSVYNTKNSQEGLATFFNQERFDILNSTHSIISRNIDLDEFNLTWSQIQNAKVKDRFQNRGTIVQATTLKSKENSKEILIVGNVHLYYHPNADHIRLLQAYYIITYLRKIMKQTKEEYPDSNVSILLCGDFNSVPECGIYQLMTRNYVPEDAADWSSCSEEIVENISLKHDFNFSSACGTPQYTNYTTIFSGCLDYIFYQTDHFKVEQVIPMPSEEELMRHVALPSVVFPSDHISLCADLKWIK